MAKSARQFSMEINGWDARYLSRERAAEDFSTEPTPLLAETTNGLPAGKALDLACGTGRNALWLASRGWQVTAVDASSAAIDFLMATATQRGVTLAAKVANLEEHEYRIEVSAWDLIVICYYLQRDLFEPAKRGVVPGGLLVSIVHITESGEEPTPHRLRPRELQKYFNDWEILHYREGRPPVSSHQRSVAEIVARRPTGTQ